MFEPNYYGVQKSDIQSSLQHFKYIKRVKKNGKWKYYYDTDSLKRDVKDVMGYDEKERMDIALKTKEKAEEDFRKAAKNAEMYEDEVISNIEDGKNLNKYSKPYWDTLEKALDAGEAYAKAQKEFNQTPLGAIKNVGGALDKAKNVVEKMLSKKKKSTTKKGKRVDLSDGVYVTFSD